MARSAALSPEQRTGKSMFATALSELLADVPVGQEKVLGSIVFGRKFYFAIFDEYHELGAATDEAFEFSRREVQADVVTIGIVDDDADERLRPDRGIHDPSADANFFGRLGHSNFLHYFASRGDSAQPTIADGGAVATSGLNSRDRAAGGRSR